MEDCLIIGDVHGCGSELNQLIESYKTNHIIILVGDMFDRGLEGLLVWSLIKEHNMICIRGNHEEKMLKYLKGERQDVPAHYHYFLNNFSKKYKISDLVEFLESLPLIYKIDENHIVAHGGVLTTMPLEEDLSANVYGKHKLNKYSQKFESNERWSDHYKEEVVVYYGHIARNNVVTGKSYSNKINSYCLDTAACHGGNLTAIEHSTKNIYQVKSRDYFTEFKNMKINIDRTIKYF
jgi:hypothetical protein